MWLIFCVNLLCRILCYPLLLLFIILYLCIHLRIVPRIIWNYYCHYSWHKMFKIRGSRQIWIHIHILVSDWLKISSMIRSRIQANSAQRQVGPAAKMVSFCQLTLTLTLNLPGNPKPAKTDCFCRWAKLSLSQVSRTPFWTTEI